MSEAVTAALIPMHPKEGQVFAVSVTSGVQTTFDAQAMVEIGLPIRITNQSTAPLFYKFSPTETANISNTSVSGADQCSAIPPLESRRAFAPVGGRWIHFLCAGTLTVYMSVDSELRT